YNRYGTLVYEAVNYKNQWNGIPNKGFPKSNSLLPVGTYYYVLHIKSLQKPLIGWVYLNY
ncbi:MAG: gliding motility-associated C-terminal domain-containing protein, partial [Bizionia sp.]|nr:gliding motility-associated C-terminal domain-containing protein [Bizionia sp.]